MAIDVYLQIDGIKGESTDSTHAGWVSRQHSGVSYNREVLQLPLLGDIQPNGASTRALH